MQVTKLANIAAKGGNIVLIYKYVILLVYLRDADEFSSNVEGFQAITVGDYNAALISPEDGAWVRAPTIYYRFASNKESSWSTSSRLVPPFPLPSLKAVEQRTSRAQPPVSFRISPPTDPPTI